MTNYKHEHIIREIPLTERGLKWLDDQITKLNSFISNYKHGELPLYRKFVQANELDAGVVTYIYSNSHTDLTMDFKPAITIAEYSLQELRAGAFADIDLQATKLRVCKESLLRFVDEQAFKSLIELAKKAGYQEIAPQAHYSLCAKWLRENGITWERTECEFITAPEFEMLPPYWDPNTLSLKFKGMSRIGGLAVYK